MADEPPMDLFEFLHGPSHPWHPDPRDFSFENPEPQCTRCDKPKEEHAGQEPT